VAAVSHAGTGSGIDTGTGPADFRRYGSARQLYHFSTHHTAAY